MAELSQETPISQSALINSKKIWKLTAGMLRRFRELNVFIAFLVICIYFNRRQPHVFTSPDNLAVIMKFVATFGMLAIGEVLVITTEGIDLSVGSLTALTSVIVAWLMSNGWNMIDLDPLAVLPAIGITLVVGVLVGIAHGLFVTKLSIPPFIITLGTLLIARGSAKYANNNYPVYLPFREEKYQDFFKLGQGTYGISIHISILGKVLVDKALAIPYSFMILLVVAALVTIILNWTKLGYRIYAVGGNLEAARLSGINVDRVRIFCYAVSGLMAAITGVLVASRMQSGQSGAANMWELWAIAAAVVGGTSLSGGEGTIFGALLGAGIMGVMQNGMTLENLKSSLQDMILGGVLVTAALYDTLRRRQIIATFVARFRRWGTQLRHRVANLSSRQAVSTEEKGG
jgi:ribose transport system permease protein